MQFTVSVPAPAARYSHATGRCRAGVDRGGPRSTANAAPVRREFAKRRPPARSTKKGTDEIGVRCGRVGPQVGHALHLEVRVAGRSRFHPARCLNAVADGDQGAELVLQVRRPVQQHARVELGPVDLAARGRVHAADGTGDRADILVIHPEGDGARTRRHRASAATRSLWSARRGRRSGGEIWILGGRVGPQVGHALDFKVHLAGRPCL